MALGQIELGEARVKSQLARNPGQRPLEDGTGEGEGVIFAVLAARVGASRHDLGRETIVDDAAQPCLVQLGQVDTGDHRPPARGYELTKQEIRRLAPQELHVRQPGGGNALLVPGSHIGEMDVAEDNPAESPSRSDDSSCRSFASISGQLLGIARRTIPIAAACISSISTRVEWKRTRRVAES